MSTPVCIAPIAFSELVDYWFGELALAEEDRIEEHVLGCAHCSEQLDELAGLGAGIRSVFRSGTVWMVISPAFVQELKQDGLRLREYRVAPGGSVNCTIGAEDDAVVSRLQVSVEGATRVDLVLSNEQGEVRLPDIPFDPAAGEVIVCPPAASLRKLPAHTAVFRLRAVDGTGERPIGDYTFIHTPS
jgi:hypothetical protein